MATKRLPSKSPAPQRPAPPRQAPQRPPAGGGLLAEIRQKRPFASRAQEAAVALLKTADGVRREASRVTEAQGITLQQFNVLRILRGSEPNGLPTLEVAERMIEATPGVTRLIDRLEEKGLARRERSVEDRRQVYCRITPEGLALLARLDPVVLDVDTYRTSKLSERELEELLRLLEVIRTG